MYPAYLRPVFIGHIALRGRLLTNQLKKSMAILEVRARIPLYHHPNVDKWIGAKVEFGDESDGYDSRWGRFDPLV
jgi:hypothetical protein